MTRLQLIDLQPDSGVQEAEYARLLGYPPHHVPEGARSNWPKGRDNGTRKRPALDLRAAKPKFGAG